MSTFEELSSSSGLKGVLAVMKRAFSFVLGRGGGGGVEREEAGKAPLIPAPNASFGNSASFDVAQ